MKDFTFLLLILFFVFGTARAQDYQLVWSDEFDGTEVDLTKWTFQLGDGSEVGLPPGWGNNEQQWYQPENTTVADGFLTITARQESAPNGYEYTSSRLRSLGKGDWTYGRFEVRAKMPIGQGMWPAIWMLSSDPSLYGVWAASGEIDIMEYLGNLPEEIFGTIHYGATFPGNLFSSTLYELPAGEPNFHEEFYTYAIEWEYGEIRWYVNDILYATKTQEDWFSTGGPSPAPFDVDFHLILNLAVGGNLPGPVDPSVLPQEFVVDYVRVYQKQNDPPSVTITSPTDGTNLSSGSLLTITADASDDQGIALVEFFQGEAKIGEDDTAPYEITIEGGADGCYSISARARDTGGLFAESSEVAVSIGSGCPAAPYLIVPSPIPGRNQAENYTIKDPGSMSSYNDTDEINDPGDYRPDQGVDIAKTYDGEFGYKIVNIEPGEWVEYIVDVAQAGDYDIKLRLSSEGSGAVVVSFNGVDKADIPYGTTGGFANWTNVTSPSIALDAGIQTMRVTFNSNNLHLNYIDVEEAADPGTGVNLIFDDMEHGNPFGNGWFAFNGAVGGGGIGASNVVPPENGGTFSLSTGWGSGGTPGFYGGFGRTFPLDLTGAETFSFWINPTVSDQEYTIEINFQEDDDGNNTIESPADDEFQYNLLVGPPGSEVVAGGGWQLVTINLDDLFDDNSFLTGGNGDFDPISTANGGNGQLINVVWAIIGTGTDANFITDYWSFSGPPAPPPVIYDDMEHGNPFGNGWFTFGGAVGGGGIGANSTDLPPNGGNFSLQTGWGSGGTPGFFGGFGRSNPVDLSGQTHFNFWINPDAGQDFLIEINLQDDDNGNNLIPFPPTGEDDEFQFNVSVGPAGSGAMVESGGGWQLVSIPLADFFDDNGFLFGGNGILDPVSVANGGNGQLINVVWAIISNSGADATFRTDNWSFTAGPEIPPITEAVWDDFEDGDASDWGFFGGNAAGGGGGIANDRPGEGDFYFSTGWGGNGSASVFYGGFFKNVAEADQVELPPDPWLNLWVFNQSNATSDSYTLEITVREDTDGNGYTQGVDDSFRFDQPFTSFDYNDQWILLSAPISSMLNLGTGIDGQFTGKLDEVVVVVSGVSGDVGATVEVDLDYIIFTSGGPLLDDTVAPEFSFCPVFEEPIALDEGLCGAVVAWDTPTASDDLSLFTLTQIEGPESGSEFPAGSTTTIVYQATDVYGNSSTCSFDITVEANDIPEISTLSGPTGPTMAGNEVWISGTFNDSNATGATVDWGDGTSSAGVIDGNNIDASHVYSSAGIYPITLILTDICEETAEATIDEIIIFDPKAGFVTGAGYFMSPLGAYKPDENKSGRFIFGFSAKYGRNRDTPSGSAAFYFRAGRFLFVSTDYQWLVVNDGMAEFQGKGRALRYGEYDFRVKAIDGKLTGSNDALKVTIWNEDGVIYDNEVTNIERGSIKIHQPKGNNSRTAAEVAGMEDLETEVPPIEQLIAQYSEVEFEVYPNPFRESIQISYVSQLATPTTVKILSVTGEEIATLFDGMTEEFEFYNWQYTPETNLLNGVYMLHIQEGNKSRIERLIHIK